MLSVPHGDRLLNIMPASLGNRSPYFLLFFLTSTLFYYGTEVLALPLISDVTWASFLTFLYLCFFPVTRRKQPLTIIIVMRIKWIAICEYSEHIKYIYILKYIWIYIYKYLYVYIFLKYIIYIYIIYFNLLGHYRHQSLWSLLWIISPSLPVHSSFVKP